MPQFSLSDDRGRSNNYDAASPDDLRKALINSLRGPVGAATPYNKGKTEDEKRAVEQLKQIEQFNEGLDEAQKTLKDILKVIRDSKRATKGTFSNVAGAVKGMGGPDNSQLEKRTFNALNKMAHEAVTGHSLHTHDHTAVRALENMHATLKQLAAVMARDKSGGGGAGRSGPGATNEGFDIPENSYGIPEYQTGVDLLDQQRSAASEVNNEMKLLRKNAGSYGRRLKLDGQEFHKLLNDMEEKVGLDREDAGYMEHALANFDRLDKSKKRALADEARRLRDLRNEIDANPMMDRQKMDRLQERYKENLNAFSSRLTHAGEATVTNFSERWGKLTAFLRMISTKDSIQVDFDLDPARMDKEYTNFLRDMNQAMYFTTGVAEDLRDSQEDFYKSAYEMGNKVKDVFRETGQMDTVLQKQIIKLTTQGVRGARQIIAVAKTSSALASTIGTEAGETTNEIAQWVNGFNMSNMAVMTLTSSMRNVARLTGVAGEDLLHAMSSARALSRQMFDLGNMTNESNEIFIRLMANSKKVGNDSKITEMLQGLMGLGSLNKMSPEMRAFMVSSASRRGMQQKLINGDILQDPQSRKEFAAGMQETFKGILSDLNVTDISQLTGDQRRVANARAERMGFAGGIGQMKQAIDTMTDDLIPLEDKMAKVVEKLSRPNKLNSDEEKDLQEELKKLAALKNNDDATKAMRDISQSMAGEGFDLAAVQDKLTRSMGTLNKTIKDPNKMLTPEKIAAAATKGERGIRDLIRDTQKAQEEAAVELKNNGLDPATRATTILANEMLAAKQVLQDIRPKLTATELVIRANTGAMLDLGGKLAEIVKTVGGLGTTFAGLTTLFSGGNFLRSLMGGVGGAGGGSGIAGLVALVVRTVGIAGLAYTAYEIISNSDTHRKGEKPADFYARKRAEGKSQLEAGWDTLTHAPKAGLGLGEELDSTAALRKSQAEEKQRQKQIDAGIAASDVGALERQLKASTDATMAASLRLQEASKTFGDLQVEYKDSFWTTSAGGTKKRLDAAQGDYERSLIESNEQTQKQQAVEKALLARRKGLYSGAVGQLGGSANPEDVERFTALLAEIQNKNAKGGPGMDHWLRTTNLQMYAERLGIKDVKAFAKAAETGTGDHFARLSKLSPEKQKEGFELSAQIAEKRKKSLVDEESYRSMMGQRAGDLDFRDKFVKMSGEALGRDFTKEFGNKDAWGHAVEAMKQSPEKAKEILQKIGGSPEMLGVLDKIIEDHRVQADAEKHLEKLMTEATTPGSIYTHDIHLEELLMPFVNKVMGGSTAGMELALAEPDMDPAMLAAESNRMAMRRALETEYASAEGGSESAAANDLLASIAGTGQQQVELLKEQLAALMGILRSVDSTGAVSGSTNVMVPNAVPNFHQWSIRQQNLTNYGGFDRG